MSIDLLILSIRLVKKCLLNFPAAWFKEWEWLQLSKSELYIIKTLEDESTCVYAQHFVFHHLGNITIILKQCLNCPFTSLFLFG